MSFCLTTTSHYASSAINLRLAAVRRLAYEASDCGLLSPDLAAGIRRVKGARRHGVRIGNWLTPEEGRQMIGRIWLINFKTAQEPRDDRCFDRLRSRKGRGCCFVAGGRPTPRRTLGDWLRSDKDLSATVVVLPTATNWKAVSAPWNTLAESFAASVYGADLARKVMLPALRIC